MGRRLHQSLREFAIICKKQQAFARVMKPPNRIHPRSNSSKKVHNSGPAFGVAHGGDVSLGLIHQQINVSLRAVQQLSADAYVVTFDISLTAKLSHDLSVDRNRTPS